MKCYYMPRAVIMHIAWTLLTTPHSIDKETEEQRLN